MQHRRNAGYQDGSLQGGQVNIGNVYVRTPVSERRSQNAGLRTPVSERQSQNASVADLRKER